MTITEVAAGSGLNAPAIRSYEKEGVLPKAVRAGGRRTYDPGILEGLAALAAKKIVELDAMAEKVAAMKALLRRRCEGQDFQECGKKISRNS